MKVSYMSRKDFLKLNENPPKDSICISIRGVYDQPVGISEQWKASIELAFEIHKFDERTRLFDAELADTVAEFIANNLNETTQNIFVHCGEGKFRSTAIATAIVEAFNNDEALEHYTWPEKMEVPVFQEMMWALYRKFPDL